MYVLRADEKKVGNKVKRKRNDSSRRWVEKVQEQEIAHD